MPKDMVELKDRKAQQAADGAKAMEEYRAEVAAVREKTVRLRAARLAREAAEARQPKAVAQRQAKAITQEKSKAA
jgi:hypothetical protein